MKREKPKAPVSLPAVHVGDFVLFGVDAVNGPSSARKEIPISRHEALVLARYWIQQYEDCDRWLRIQYSSTDYRIKVYAESRIGELLDLGMVTQQQVDQIVHEIEAKDAEARSPDRQSPAAESHAIKSHTARAAKSRHRAPNRRDRSR